MAAAKGTGRSFLPQKLGRHVKSPNEESPNGKSPNGKSPNEKSLKLKNRAWSGPDSPPQA